MGRDNLKTTAPIGATSFHEKKEDAAKGGIAQSGKAGAAWPRFPASLENLVEFWEQRAKQLVSWSKQWDTVLAGDFNTPEIKWFPGGKLNASYNCLDRHLVDGRRNKAALIWQGEKDSEVRVFTYQMLFSEVCRLANVLKKKGVKKGDRVSIYLPMLPELVIAVLACARIGAVHCVVFSGFSAVSLQNRLKNCRPKVLITADAIIRAGRTIPLKPNADEAMEECRLVESCIVVRRTDRETSMTSDRDSWWHDEMNAPDIDNRCDAEEMDANDALFILYTSGSTGEPKGVVHTTGGYLLYVMHTCQLVFDLRDDDIFWCTADLGWMTGHSYSIYGPLGLGGTTLIYEGIPLYPEPDRYWQIVEKFCVNIFYTAPTLIRALMRFGVEPVQKHDISSLRLLGSVGEPITPEAWSWYNEHIGRTRLPIVDTWWQTETGGIMIAPLPSTVPLKPGSAALPLPGIDAVVVDEAGREVDPDEGGRLVIRKPWPGMLKGLYGGKASLRKTYLEVVPGGYDTGDGARRDADGYFWIIGRLDDVINVSGHRLGTAEIEAALLTHRSVAEAAVVGIPHSLKGQAVYAYVTVNINVEQTPELLEELRHHVCERIGPIASPDAIQYASGLPKTRSGKIMRRLLKRIAADEFDNFGDVSSLADPSILADLIDGKRNIYEI
jgi:acetyl-CoA synthetase